MFKKAWQGPRDKPDPPSGDDAVTTTHVVLGTRACDEFECDQQNAARCSYVDRRQRPCRTAWCPDHQVVIGRRAYCRRHAGTLRAFGYEIPASGDLPDLDNRAPSLVSWVCHDLDLTVRSLLECLPGRRREEHVGSDAVHPTRGKDGVHWRRSWKLFDQTGVTAQVTVEVREKNDAEVLVTVGHVLVAQGIPPWISRRRRGETVSADEDAAERKEWYELIHSRVATGLAGKQIADPALGERVGADVGAAPGGTIAAEDADAARTAPEGQDQPSAVIPISANNAPVDGLPDTSEAGRPLLTVVGAHQDDSAKSLATYPPLASQLCGAQGASLFLIDTDRQWLEAVIGVPDRWLHAVMSLCASSLLSSEPTVIPDLRFEQRKLLAAAPEAERADQELVFFAGFPFFDSAGQPRGVLCAVDTTPRYPTDGRIAALVALAHEVGALLDIRDQLEKRRRNRAAG